MEEISKANLAVKRAEHYTIHSILALKLRQQYLILSIREELIELKIYLLMSLLYLIQLHDSDDTEH